MAEGCPGVGCVVTVVPIARFIVAKKTFHVKGMSKEIGRPVWAFKLGVGVLVEGVNMSRKRSKECT